MSKLILAAPAAAALCVGACNYNENYNKEGYNAADANYSAEQGNYTGNESSYGNATDYNATNQTYETNEMANTAANAAADSVTNNSY